jgi:hypothetical protein
MWADSGIRSAGSDELRSASPSHGRWHAERIRAHFLRTSPVWIENESRSFGPGDPRHRAPKGGCTTHEAGEHIRTAAVWSTAMTHGFQYGLNYYKFSVPTRTPRDTCAQRDWPQACTRYPIGQADSTHVRPNEDLREVLADFILHHEQVRRLVRLSLQNLGSSSPSPAAPRFSPMKSAQTTLSLECDFRRCEAETSAATRRNGVPKEASCVWVDAACRDFTACRGLAGRRNPAKQTDQHHEYQPLSPEGHRPCSGVP